MWLVPLEQYASFLVWRRGSTRPAPSFGVLHGGVQGTLREGLLPGPNPNSTQLSNRSVSSAAKKDARSSEHANFRDTTQTIVRLAVSQTMSQLLGGVGGLLGWVGVGGVFGGLEPRPSRDAADEQVLEPVAEPAG